MTATTKSEWAALADWLRMAHELLDDKGPETRLSFDAGDDSATSEPSAEKLRPFQESVPAKLTAFASDRMLVR